MDTSRTGFRPLLQRCIVSLNIAIMVSACDAGSGTRQDMIGAPDTGIPDTGIPDTGIPDGPDTGSPKPDATILGGEPDTGPAGESMMKPDAVVPEPAPIIDRLLPVDNPAGGPVLIRGRHLGNTRAVTFGGIEADFTVFSDTEVAVHVPATSAIGMTDIRLMTDEVSSLPIPFGVLAAYPPGPRSPPDIIALIRGGIDTFPPVTNAWSSEDCRYSLTFDCDLTNHTQSLSGTESCGDGPDNDVRGDWDMQEKAVSMTVTRDNGAEQYEGMFIESDIVDMVLFSTTTGRQLSISIGQSGYERCEEQPQDGVFCRCEDDYICSLEQNISAACLEERCAACRP